MSDGHLDREARVDAGVLGQVDRPDDHGDHDDQDQENAGPDPRDGWPLLRAGAARLLVDGELAKRGSPSPAVIVGLTPKSVELKSLAGTTCRMTGAAPAARGLQLLAELGGALEAREAILRQRVGDDGIDRRRDRGVERTRRRPEPGSRAGTRRQPGFRRGTAAGR